MLPGAITRKIAEPRMAAGRFTAYEDTTGQELRSAISTWQLAKPKTLETQRKGGSGEKQN